MVLIKNPLSGGGGGGGDIVNSIIREYLASTSDIEAGTFVEFVGSWGTKTEISSENSSTNDFSAVALDDTRVFVAHKVSSGSHLYGVICTITGSTIAIGTDTAIVTTSGADSGTVISVCLIGEDEVFIAHNRSSSSYYLNAVVCTISGNTITVGSDTQISTTANTAKKISAVALDTDKVFLAHSYGTNYIRGVVCSISDLLITAGTDTSLESNQVGYYLHACRLSSDKVVVVGVATPASGTAPVYGIACTIADTTITAGTLTAVSEYYNYCGYSLSAVGIDDTRVAVVFSGSSSYYLYGTVCYVSGTRTLNKTSDTQLSTLANSGRYSFIGKTYSGVVVLYATNTDFDLGVMLGTVYDTALAVGSSTTLSNTNSSAVNAKSVDVGGNILVLYPEAQYHLNGIVQEQKIKAATSRIDGLTKTEATTSSAGEVYVLNN